VHPFNEKDCVSITTFLAHVIAASTTIEVLVPHQTGLLGTSRISLKQDDGAFLFLDAVLVPSGDRFFFTTFVSIQSGVCWPELICTFGDTWKHE
jgi:hypothetical protein